MNTYIVKAGDTLQSIAASQIGDESLWPYLASINSISSPYTVVPGQQLITEVAEVSASKWGGGVIALLLGSAAVWYFFFRDKNEKKEAQ